MARKRHVKAVLEVFENEGLQLSDQRTTSGGHQCVTLTNGRGNSTLYFFATTASDWRALKKVRSDARRFQSTGYIKGTPA